MKNPFAAVMRRATATTRAFSPLGATRMIQAALSRAGGPAGGFKSGSMSGLWPKGRQTEATLRGLLALQRLPSTEVQPNHAPADDAAFTTRSFVCTAGMRDYKLYCPAAAASAPRGLIIMLHGCTQNPDDFATGTGMNILAESHGLIVAYPAQTRAHNASGCWNWFQTGDQVRDKGEPAILAGIARELMAEFGLGREQVFIAGLSAGGAMSVIMAETYPDVFSAVGVHSGLPYQSASNVMSALTAMRGRVARHPANSAANPAANSAATSPVSQPTGHAPVRTIIFHGSADKTVHPSNAKGIANDALLHLEGAMTATETGKTNGKGFARMIISDSNGCAIVENWSIEGAGHAWSGGNRSGSFADPHGPDASAEMVRFFLGERHAG